jgi:hypothetical protein
MAKKSVRSTSKAVPAPELATKASIKRLQKREIGGKFLSQWKGKPFEGEQRLRGNNDPEWDQPVPDHRFYIFKTDTWDPDGMKELERWLTETQTNTVVVHRQFKEWSAENDGWHILTMLSEQFMRDATPDEKQQMQEQSWFSDTVSDVLAIGPKDPDEAEKQAMRELKVLQRLAPRGPIQQRMFRTEDVTVDVPSMESIFHDVLMGTATLLDENVQYAGNGRWRFLLTWKNHSTETLP